MGRINSDMKGKKGELEVANLFKSYGFEEARRSQQYSGAGHTADVEGMPGLHIEVKRVEALNIYKAIEKCHNEKRDEDYGVLVHRKNRKPWLVTMEFDEWIELYKRSLLVD